MATVIPTETGCSMLLDVGANAECRSEMLVQFAHMGSFYMEKVQGVANPKVGIINIGAEESKGLDLQVETYRTLSQSNLNFSGNIEAREIPAGGCDVLVADGFTGNVVLKLIEGMGKFMSHSLKGLFKKNALTMVSALFVKNGLADIKKKMDYTEYGGAPLLGISRPVIKAHGSSNAKAFQMPFVKQSACATSIWWTRYEPMWRVRRPLRKKDWNERVSATIRLSFFSSPLS